MIHPRSYDLRIGSFLFLGVNGLFLDDRDADYKILCLKCNRHFSIRRERLAWLGALDCPHCSDEPNTIGESYVHR
jgi:DNA-directed RNA polymerase subunit RPC12/RpoP